MKRCMLLLGCSLAFIVLNSWGFFPHKLINEHAVYTLPVDLSSFYKKNKYYIREYAIQADKRVYIDPKESPRHFIDLDKLEGIDSLQVPWYKVQDIYQQRYGLNRGIIPWQIEATYMRLVKAFRNKDSKRIIQLSADLGHYTADAHVPLHTSSNYNGQFTNQIGIHALWETRLPEKFSGTYKLYVGQAAYVDDVLGYAWRIVQESHSLLDSVLFIEKELAQEIPKALQRSYRLRGQQIQANYSDYYASAYHKRLNQMVERQMRKSIHAVGSLWMSAWVDAGQPDLTQSKALKTIDTLLIPNSGQALGREEWH